MLYISGIHALNLPCSLPTCGDWHSSGIQWKKLTIRESSESIFGEYGVEDCSVVPEHPGTHKVANHVRALLDMISEGQFGYAQGMRKDFICNDSLDSEVFSKVLLLRNSSRWNEINQFMGREYAMRWLRFLESQGIRTITRPAYDIDSLINKINKNNQHNDFDEGNPSGNEVW